NRLNRGAQNVPLGAPLRQPCLSVPWSPAAAAVVTTVRSLPAAVPALPARAVPAAVREPLSAQAQVAAVPAAAPVLPAPRAAPAAVVRRRPSPSAAPSMVCPGPAWPLQTPLAAMQR